MSKVVVGFSWLLKPMHYDFDYKSYERREGMAVSSCCSSGFNVKHGPYVGSREWWTLTLL